MKKCIAYFCKACYLFLSWWFIVYTCYGELNVSLLCSSIFIYTGGVALDSLFVFFESHDINTILRYPVMALSFISLIGDVLLAVLCVIVGGFIVVPYVEDVGGYIIILNNTIPNGFNTLYPELASFEIGLKDFMTGIMCMGLFSMIPAVLLEFDSYMKIKNDKYAVDQHNKKNKGR